MTSHWKDHFNANAENFRSSPLKQVDRTLNGNEIDQSQVDFTVRAIIENLSISRSDNVADVCCGNGLITRIIADRCNSVIGFDFSDKLIEHARLISTGPNVEYVVSDASALDIHGLSSRPEKFFMQDSIQFMDRRIFSGLLNSVDRITEFKNLLVSGIPDPAKLRVYYDTDEKLAYYHKREEEGRPHIGTWWNRDELSAIVVDAGFRVSFMDQNPALCTAHYRYDCLIERA